MYVWGLAADMCRTVSDSNTLWRWSPSPTVAASEVMTNRGPGGGLGVHLEVMPHPLTAWKREGKGRDRVQLLSWTRSDLGILNCGGLRCPWATTYQVALNIFHASVKCETKGLLEKIKISSGHGSKCCGEGHVGVNYNYKWFFLLD